MVHAQRPVEQIIKHKQEWVNGLDILKYINSQCNCCHVFFYSTTNKLIFVKKNIFHKGGCLPRHQNIEISQTMS